MYVCIYFNARLLFFFKETHSLINFFPQKKWQYNPLKKKINIWKLPFPNNKKQLPKPLPPSFY